MQSWSEITHYAGFDWATDHHDVIIVNRSGKIVADFQIEHTAEGWQRWLEQVAALGSWLAACVETSQGFVAPAATGKRCRCLPYFNNER